MLDFGVLPPEINSGRMWTDIVGSEPLAEAGAAWQSLTVMLGSSAAAFNAVVAELTGASWLGPSALAMAAAAAPFAVWLAAHAAQAEQAALMAIQAAGAFEAARLGHIHPTLIAENRAELATLVSTNFMGVNTPAIGANEALYSEYWAQDAAAMYGYAANGAAITGTLAGSPFMPPTSITDPAGVASQAASTGETAGQSASNSASTATNTLGQTHLPGGLSASGVAGMAPQLMGMVPQALSGLAGGGGSMNPAGMLGQFGSLLQPLMGATAFGSMMNGLGASGPLGSLSSAGLGGWHM